MKRIRINTNEAPKAIGPYSQGIEISGQTRIIYFSGQIALDPAADKPTIVGNTVEAQTHQVMKNISGLLRASGATFSDIVKTTIFLKDMADFPKVNEIYGSHFTQDPPARSTVAAAGLPMGVLVEIECIVAL